MGTRDELAHLSRFVVQQSIEPVIDTVLPLTAAREGFARMVDGEVFGKVVFTVS
jgi:NADPH:quinone reductase-like Zn-dependent oxidoreductase